MVDIDLRRFKKMKPLLVCKFNSYMWYADLTKLVKQRKPRRRVVKIKPIQNKLGNVQIIFDSTQQK